MTWIYKITEKSARGGPEGSLFKYSNKLGANHVVKVKPMRFHVINLKMKCLALGYSKHLDEYSS